MVPVSTIKNPQGSLGVTTNPAEPKWLRTAAVSSRYGFSRTFIFKRLNDGSFESKMVVEPGARRGIRLINVASIVRYLARFDREGAIVK
jgi:hypothetical protein